MIMSCVCCSALRCSVRCSALQRALHCRRCDCVMCVLQRVAVCVAVCCKLVVVCVCVTSHTQTLKLHVSFAKETYIKDHILQKRDHILQWKHTRVYLARRQGAHIA